MKCYVNPQVYSRSAADRLAERQRIGDAIIARGTERTPEPPRQLIAQPGARKSVLSWVWPIEHKDVVGWQIFKANDSFPMYSIKDKNITSYDVALNSGATPEVVDLYVCSVNAAGVISQKVRVSASAKAETGAPTDPAPVVRVATTRLLIKG